MCVAVITYKACSIQAQSNMQVLNTNIVQHRIIGTLQKRAINGSHRLKSRSSNSGCRSNCVLLRNTHVKKSLRMRLCKSRKSCTVRHGRRNTNNFFISIRQFRNRLAKNLSIGYRCIGIGNFFTCSYFVRAGSMKFIRTFLRRLIALAFFRKHMHHYRPVDFSGSLQYINQAFNIMAVNRSQISKA